MRAGVVTFHGANNYGAILQSWALQKVLGSLGVDAYIINYHPRVIDILYDPMKCKTGLPRKAEHLKQFILNRDSLVRYKKFIHFMKQNFKLLGDFSTYGELSKAQLNLDAYITGSDQVWNDTHTGGYDPAYMLEFAEPGSVKISYAASIGRDYFNPRYKKQYKKGLAGLDYISVREPSLVGAVKKLTDKPVEVVLDPTMLLCGEDYDEIKVKSPVKEKYILVYMIEKNSELIRFANRISVALGLPLIQRRPVPGLKNELPPYYTADAGEFLGLMESAEYVITNSFHGTVFSVLYERPFISMLHSDTGSRTADLLEGLGLQSHIMYDVDEFKDFGRFAINDAVKLKKDIEAMKAGSIDFLKRSLGL
jgi:hypothetical protein